MAVALGMATVQQLRMQLVALWSSRFSVIVYMVIATQVYRLYLLNRSYLSLGKHDLLLFIQYIFSAQVRPLTYTFCINRGPIRPSQFVRWPAHRIEALQ